MAPGILQDSSAATTRSTIYFPKSPAPLSRVVHHGLITEEFDALRFHAAASLQLVTPLGHGSLPLLDNKLISSPYNDSDHLLDLDTLSLQDKVLALALTTMKPILGDYATEDYELSFNWVEIFTTARVLASSVNHPWTKQEFYVVIFRSQLKDGCDKQLLHDLDKHSHREATVSGGLLKYWFGRCNSDRQNLATCIWRNREDARAGGTGPWHHKARLSARVLYDYIRFSTWKLTVEDGATSWRIEKWDS